jgi:hypothetical protein
MPAMHMSPTLAVWAAKIAGKFVAAVLVTDFVSGVFHWFEDAYGREDFPITGNWITRKNILHHHDPRNFVKNSWWQSSWDLALASGLVVAGAWLIGRLSWPVWVFAVIGANANQIHKWTHRTPRENGTLITWMQRLHLVQGVRHHARHHTNPKDSNYCVITDFLNPILDGIRFWDGLEFVFLHLFGMRRKVDKSVRSSADKNDRAAAAIG